MKTLTFPLHFANTLVKISCENNSVFAVSLIEKSKLHVETMETTFLENNESEFTHDECSSVLFKWLSNYNQRIFHKFPLALLSFPEDFPPGYLELLLKLHSLPLDLITYGSLALEAGIKNGARAAGSAMRRNPFPLIIPCHRVVSVSGLGGYTPGAFIKEELLVHEGLIKR